MFSCLPCHSRSRTLECLPGFYIGTLLDYIELFKQCSLNQDPILKNSLSNDILSLNEYAFNDLFMPDFMFALTGRQGSIPCVICHSV